MLEFKNTADPQSKDVYRTFPNNNSIRLGTIMWHQNRTPRIVLNPEIPIIFLSLSELKECQLELEKSK